MEEKNIQGPEKYEKPKKQFMIVKGIVIDSEGRILVLQRDRDWHKEAHKKWEFPGGKVDFGEHPEETCIREIFEESGYNASVRKVLPKIESSYWEYEDRDSQQILICYVCDLIDGNPNLEDHGVMKLKWCLPDEIFELEVLPKTHEFLKIYLENKKN